MPRRIAFFDLDAECGPSPYAAYVTDATESAPTDWSKQPTNNGKPWRYEPPQHTEPTNAEFGIEPWTGWRLVLGLLAFFGIGYAVLVLIVMAVMWAIALARGLA